MATLSLNPSGYTGSTSISTSSSYPISNGYTDTSSTTYARLSLSTSTAGYLYYTFDCSSIPSNATISSITGSAKVRVSSTSRVTSTICQLFTGTTAKGSNVTFASTSTSNVVTLSPGSSWTRSELDDLRLKIGGTGSSSSQSKYIYFYGADITITYTAGSPRTITSTISGSGTISPSGATTMYDSEEYTLTITPTDTSAAVTVTNNGSDVTSSLVEHYSGGTDTYTAESFTTEINGSGGAFYTGSSTTGNYFNYAVGHTAESPGSTSTSYNTYVKDNSSNTATGYAWYSFDFSDIPSGATIDSVEVRCYGACENTTHDSTHKANIILYSGTTAKSTEQYFTSTSNSIITITNPGTWTRAELQNAKLRFEVAYYGGRLFGISWEVTYHVESANPEYYTYTYTVSGDATIVVTIGGSTVTKTFYRKVNGTWTVMSVTEVYKKVNGAWVLQSTWEDAFDTNTNYVYVS